MRHISRVLQVVAVMNQGGAENMIMNYYRAADKSKIQFDFLVHYPKRGFFDDEIEKMGGHIYRALFVHGIIASILNGLIVFLKNIMIM